MDQAGPRDDFLELGDKWCMGTIHDVLMDSQLIRYIYD